MAPPPQIRDRPLFEIVEPRPYFLACVMMTQTLPNLVVVSFGILKELFAINFNRSKFVRSAYATKVCHEMGYIEDTLNVTTRSKPIKIAIILVG